MQADLSLRWAHMSEGTSLTRKPTFVIPLCFNNVSVKAVLLLNSVSVLYGVGSEV